MACGGAALAEARWLMLVLERRFMKVAQRRFAPNHSGDKSRALHNAGASIDAPLCPLRLSQSSAF